MEVAGTKNAPSGKWRVEVDSCAHSCYAIAHKELMVAEEDRCCLVAAVAYQKPSWQVVRHTKSAAAGNACHVHMDHAGGDSMASRQEAVAEYASGWVAPNLGAHSTADHTEWVNACSLDSP